MNTSRRFASLLAAAGLFTALQAHAATVVLDGANGAVYDGVGDGWFFAGPSQPPPDGVGDAAGQSLSVGFITNVLEIRAMAEFGLTSLGGVDPNDIISATLTVTIDDVIPTFGPGATFDGTASNPIAVGNYVGDGAVTLADFAVATSAIGTMTPGVVTDATLANTGALPFDFDVTTQLRAAVVAANTAFGIKLTTADSPTATSLDNLAPPGVAGGKLPFITVIVADPTTTTTIPTTTSTTFVTTSTSTTFVTTSTSTTFVTSTTTTTIASTTTSTTIAPTTTTIAPTTTTTTIAPTTTTIAPTTTSTTIASTTTTIAPTTTIATTTTSTSTTTIPPSTTTTTLPDTCVIAATYDSIRCRLDELADTVATEPSLAGVAAKLTTNIDKANELLDKAEAGSGRATRSALRKVGTRLRAIGRPVRSLHGRRTIDEEVRADMLATLEGLLADVKTLMKAS
ncbi:MAG TPA: hypothetical protein VGR62_23640 [Candidatus Binatia bacterium]|jgi:hypothetical protein|nr:hypothetical protein [Candidatus Binatia bacterium]